jgi:hypothetical protein
MAMMIVFYRVSEEIFWEFRGAKNHVGFALESDKAGKFELF